MQLALHAQKRGHGRGHVQLETPFSVVSQPWMFPGAPSVFHLRHGVGLRIVMSWGKMAHVFPDVLGNCCCAARCCWGRCVPSTRCALARNALVWHTPKDPQASGHQFCAQSIVKAHIATVVLSALRNATTLVADEPRQMEDQGNSFGAQGEPRNHAEEAESKESRIENPEVSTGGCVTREGIPVAQPVTSRRSSELGSGARHSLTTDEVLEQFGDLTVSAGRRVAKCVLHCDGIDKGVNNLVRTTTTTDLESREFAFHRCLDEGTTLRTWACTIEKCGDPCCAPPGMADPMERKAKLQPSVRDIAGAIDSFRRHCPVEGKLCVATVSPAQFRGNARGLRDEIEARAALVGQADLGFGCKCFQTCLSSHALERLRREAVRNGCASESPETQFEMALQHLCDEEDEEKLQRDFEDELDFLRRKRCRNVDAMQRQFSELLLEFAGLHFGHANKLRCFRRLLVGHQLHDRFIAPLDGFRQFSILVEIHSARGTAFRTLQAPELARCNEHKAQLTKPESPRARSVAPHFGSAVSRERHLP
eukprot:jgi/Bigna1/66369/fgenesh1_pg.1_\